MNGVVAVAVPNGGKRNLKDARVLRATGTKRGFPDVLIFSRPPLFPDAPGTAVELKTHNGNESDVRPDQQRWLKTLSGLGWQTVVAFGCADALRQLRELGYSV